MCPVRGNIPTYQRGPTAQNAGEGRGIERGKGAGRGGEGLERGEESSGRVVSRWAQQDNGASEEGCVVYFSSPFLVLYLALPFFILFYPLYLLVLVLSFALFFVSPRMLLRLGVQVPLC